MRRGETPSHRKRLNTETENLVVQTKGGLFAWEFLFFKSAAFSMGTPGNLLAMRGKGLARQGEIPPVKSGERATYHLSL